MTDYAPDAVPALPLAALREALGRADLKAAQALLEAHDQAVRQALAGDAVDLLAPRQRAQWARLLDEQQALTEELAQLRDRVARQWQDLQRHQRGVLAYRQELP